MDPATAIGLVSGILSFVGAAEKIMKLTWTLYNSVEGSSEETETRLKVAESMTIIGDRLVLEPQPPLAEQDRALIALAQECSELTNDIRKELQNLRPKRRKSKTQSGFVALKTMIFEPRIKDLEKRLQHCRDQLHFHISALSSENLKTLLATYKDDRVKLARLELSISQLRQTLQDMTAKKVEPISSQAIDQLQHLLCVGQNALDEVAHDRILRGIKAGFQDMSFRYEKVVEPFGRTFEWVFELNGSSFEAAKFIQWLSSGDGIFHICGKLGSGKSTLKLKGGQHLVVANFFFYALGSDPRQKSLIGLNRTLLHQILTANPGLMRNLFPDQWKKALSQPKIQSTYEILDDDIKQAYQRLSKHWNSNFQSGYCFCFFIDGLDEYHATTAVDRREMVRSLTDLTNSSSGNFKLCVSSRMENPFMDMFSEDNRFYLHELTKSDMEEYVQGNLQHVGTEEERWKLASSITEKAEGIFLWVVLVVQNIRGQADDGARFSRLLGEIESLPIELDELFQRILEGLRATDHRLMSRTVSLLRFLGGIPEARKKRLWLSLSDFHFIEDYEADTEFAENVQLIKSELETVKEGKSRARRQLRSACRGLVDADKEGRLDFTHRSVRDFFDQQKVRAETHDESFNDLQALSQLKLATVRQYWWDVERKHGRATKDEREREDETLNNHSILTASLVELRREQQLDAPPFHFLECLDTIPQLSVAKMIRRTLALHKTAFRITLPKTRLSGRSPYHSFEICHTSRVWHGLLDRYGNRGDEHEYEEAVVDTENPTVPWRAADETVDMVEEYSTAMVSPLLIELSLGRLDYPFWRIRRIHDMPIEPEKLAMLAYYAAAVGIGQVFGEKRASERADDDVDSSALRRSGLRFLRHLFEQHILSPNLLTHLAYGGEFGFVRIAAANQPLSIWQHFFCWWVTVVATSGEFGPDMDSRTAIETLSKDRLEHIRKCTYNPSKQQSATGMVLQTFITNGADLLLTLKIANSKQLETRSVPDDIWIQYFLEMTTHGGEALQVEVVVNLGCRLDPAECNVYPYGPPKCQVLKGLYDDDWILHVLPESPLSIGDWIGRSRLPNKDVLLKLIDERLGTGNLSDVPGSNPGDAKGGSLKRD